MIRRIVDEERRHRRSVGRSAPANFLEPWILMIPIFFALFAFILMFFSFQKQATQPATCLDPKGPGMCEPKLVIAVTLTDYSLKQARAAIDSWIKEAGKIGISVVFFGDYEDPDLPCIRLKSKDKMDRAEEIWNWLYYHYAKTYHWFMNIPDTTFVHPYFLTKRILCSRDPNMDWYIGENGFSPATKTFKFSGSGAGYIFSRSTLIKLLEAWNKGESCQFSIAEDVTISKCIQSMGIKLTGNSQFHSNEPQHYFTQVLEFLSMAKQTPEKMAKLANRFFANCDY